MYDPPTTAELVTAVREFLEQFCEPPKRDLTLHEFHAVVRRRHLHVRCRSRGEFEFAREFRNVSRVSTEGAADRRGGVVAAAAVSVEDEDERW